MTFNERWRGGGAPPPPARCGAAAVEAVPVPRGCAGRGLESFAAILGCFTPPPPPPPTLRPRPWGRCWRGGGTSECGRRFPPARPVPPFPHVGDPVRPGRWRVGSPHNFLGASGGWFWGCGEALGVSPPPPPKLPARGAPGRPPEQGTRGRGEGLPWLHLRSPAHAGAGGCLSPAGAGLGALGHPTVPGPVTGTGAAARWHLSQGR